MSLGKIIRKRREELHLTLDDVALTTGFSKPYLSTIETGKVKPPGDTLLGKLEAVLNFKKGLLRHIAHVERMPADVRQDYEAIDAENKELKQMIRNIIEHGSDADEISEMFSGNEINVEPETVQLTPGQLVPVINKVSAGYPVDFDDLGYPAGFADDYVRCPDLHDPNAFAVRVVGDSMESKFFEGDIVVFSPSTQVNNGDDCFVRFAFPHESTFKRVFFEADDNIRLQPRNDNYPPAIVDGKRINGLYRAVIRYEKL